MRSKWISQKVNRLFFSCLFFCCAFSFIAKSQVIPAPQWKCIQTNSTDLLLSWTTVTDPGNQFVQYEVWSAEDGLIAVIPSISTTSYAVPNVFSVKNYFIRVVDNSGSSDSPIYQNVRLTVNNPSNGTAILNWNTPNINISNPSNSQVYIEREYPAGQWSVIDSLAYGTSFYRDTIDVCQAQINYRIKLAGFGCFSLSNIAGDVFEDRITPDIPKISFVSIDTLTNNVQIEWNMNRQKDTYGYVIYKKDAAGFFVELDKVWGVANTSYSYSENTGIDALTYSIAAFDSCFTQTLPPTYQTSAKAAPHTSLFVRGSYNPCTASVTVDWSGYIGASGAIVYEVFATDEQNNWQSRGTTTAQQFTIAFQNSGTYTFVIKGTFANGLITFSNKISFDVSTSGPPSIHYIVSASVDKTGVNLTHLIDPNGNVLWVAFDRRDNAGSFNEVGRVRVMGSLVNFLDESARLDKVNEYRAVVIDSCGNRTLVSNSVFTVYLQVESHPNNYSTSMTWTPYIGYDGGVNEYEVYRGIDDVWQTVPAAVLSSNTFYFEEELGDLFASKTLCYRIVAVENLNSYGIVGAAKSNASCVSFSPTLYIPNAFSPTGVNRYFKPVFSYQDYPNYEMLIFNRWAQLVHQSSSAAPGWGGNILDSDEPAELGIYIYRIRFYDNFDNVIEREGSVTLIR